ncbi:MAG: right-handed parallel beta-helix repeat-containing protein [archaeon]|nr:right-handed parallel beta-helix repeat-containing protein [archaeon]
MDITTDKVGIEIGESNILIDNNTVNYNNSYGIYARGKMSNVTITNNFLEGSGIGVLVKYQSSKKRPKDFVIINNTVNTSNIIAIDFANIIEDTFTVLGNKIRSNKIILPSGEIQSNSSSEVPSKIYYIDENNFSQFFDNEDNLSPSINDGDSLIFVKLSKIKVF